MRVLIIGCGYVGLALGRLLAGLGHEVCGLRRSRAADEELRAASITPLHADIRNPEELSSLPDDFEWVVNLVSSGRGGEEEYRRTYLEGTGRVIQWLSASPLRKYVYTSSTSVYPQADSSIVDERSPAVPFSSTSALLVQTEDLILSEAKEGHFPGIILRVAGIYGPGRGHLFHRFLRGEAALLGKGDRILNMVHLNDVVGAIAVALERGAPGAVYNVVDDEPVAERDFFEWLAGQTGRELPPEAPLELAQDRKRGLTSKRVSNARLKTELGWQLQFPTFRHGYAPELARLFGQKKQVPRTGRHEGPPSQI